MDFAQVVIGDSPSYIDAFDARRFGRDAENDSMPFFVPRRKLLQVRDLQPSHKNLEVFLTEKTQDASRLGGSSVFKDL